MTATTFRHLTPALRVFSGPDALSHLPKELSRHGARRALVVTVPPMRDHPSFAAVEESLGDRLVGVFDDVVEHSPLPAVERAVEVLRGCGADSVVVVGGGSAIVTARAAVMLHAEQRPIRDLCTTTGDDGRLVSPRLSAPKLPQWIVPSSPTTAFARVGAAVRDPDTGERLALYDPKARAQGVFFDPGVAGSAPVGMVRSSVLTAWSMAIEGLQNPAIDPIAQALLMEAVSLVRDAVTPFARDGANEDVRLRLMSAALLSGQGSEYTGGGMATGLSHALAQHADAPNGVVESIVLPHCVRFNAPVTAPRLADIVTRLGMGEASESTAADSVAELSWDVLHRLGLPVRLRDVGMPQDAIPNVVDLCEDDWFLRSVPRPASRGELEELVAAAW